MKYIYFFSLIFLFGCQKASNEASDSSENRLNQVHVSKIPSNSKLIAEPSYIRLKDSIHHRLKILDDVILLETLDNYSDLPVTFLSSFDTREKIIFEGEQSDFFTKKKLKITFENGYEKDSSINVLELFDNEKFKGIAQKYMIENSRKAYRITIIMKVTISLTRSNFFKTTQENDFFYIKFPSQLELSCKSKQT